MSVISKNQVSLAGEFAVLSQLALRGFDANMTLGNTKGVDILVSHPETDSMYRLEVKTALNSKPWRSKRFGNIIASWPMGDKHEKNVDRKLFYCFVGIAENTQVFDFFVVPSVVVAKFVTESHRYWLAADPTHRDTTMRLFMLGNKDDRYPIEMPAAEDYRARWDMLK
jgi:hypothetical protein